VLRDYVVHHFGTGIAREFMFPYNRKLWGVESGAISRAWCQRFVPIPELRRIVEGAFTSDNEGDGYNAAFSYPEAGGIGAFSTALSTQVPNLRTGVRVRRVNGREKWVETADGVRWGFEHLVSTIPLKQLIVMCHEAPEEVVRAGQLLACTSLTYFDLGLRKPALEGLHWVYLPHPDLPAYRIGSYSNACPAMAPPTGSSLYVELANDRQVEPEAALDSVLEVLSGLGPAVGRDDVAVWNVRHIEFAYVLYDEHYQRARALALEYLSGLGIQSIGRYGKWVYASMEDALLDGRRAARRCADVDRG